MPNRSVVAGVVEVLNAVADLSFIVIALVVLALALIFRDPLRSLLSDPKRKFRLKHKDTEFELSAPEESTLPPSDIASGAAQALPALTSDFEDVDVETADEAGSDIQDDEPTLGFLIALLGTGDTERAAAVFEQLLQRAETDADKLALRAEYAFYQHEIAGKLDAVRDLEELAAQDGAPSRIHLLLGRVYAAAHDFDQAITELKNAAAQAETEDDRVAAIIQLARVHLAHGKDSDAYVLLRGELATSDLTPKSCARLYRTIAEVADRTKTYGVSAIARDKALEFEPNHGDDRFDAAYGYTQAEYNDLALMHYRALLARDPGHGTAANNLGVVFGNLDMPIHAIASLAVARDSGSALSRANLAFRYLDAGFAAAALQELQAIPPEQLTETPRIGAALTAVTERPESEDRREEELLATATRAQGFLRHYASSYLPSLGLPEDLSGDYRGKGAKAAVSLSGRELTIEWVANAKRNRISGSMQNRGAPIDYYESPDRDDETYSRIAGGWLYVDDAGVIRVMFSSADRAEVTFVRSIPAPVVPG
jgi:tetratricopeptide (TPR) repeat protein